MPEEEEKELIPGKWHDPAADKFPTADAAVAVLEQTQIYLGTFRKEYPTGFVNPVRTDRFIG